MNSFQTDFKNFSKLINYNPNISSNSSTFWWSFSTFTLISLFRRFLSFKISSVYILIPLLICSTSSRRLTSLATLFDSQYAKIAKNNRITIFITNRVGSWAIKNKSMFSFQFSGFNQKIKQIFHILSEKPFINYTKPYQKPQQTEFVDDCRYVNKELSGNVSYVSEPRQIF